MFSSHPVNEFNINFLIGNPDSSKVTQRQNISPKILKENTEVCSTILCADINRCIHRGTLLKILEDADITHARLFNVNYRPDFTNAFKIYEKVLYKQIEKYFDKMLS